MSMSASLADTLAAVEAAIQLADLTEHLLQPHKRKIADPQINHIKAVLQKRFRAQHRAVKAALRGQRHLISEATHPIATAAILGALILPRRVNANPAVTRALANAYDGGAGSVADDLGADPAGGEPGRNAIDIALGLDSTTEKSLLGVLVKDLAYTALVSQIGLVFQDAIDNRAEAAAITEVTGAWSNGASATAQAVSDLGEDVEMHWDAEPDACDDCLENEALEWISIDDVFPNGDEPPLHPNCRCDLVYRRSPNAPDFTA
jgi:hypothetical protein